MLNCIQAPRAVALGINGDGIHAAGAWRCGYITRVPASTMDELLSIVHEKRAQTAQHTATQIQHFHEQRTLAACQQPRQPTAEKIVNIDLYFYKPHANDYAINRAVAWATGRQVLNNTGQPVQYAFAHVELCFGFSPHDGKALLGENYSFSIAQGTNVYLRRRERWRSEYMAVAVPITLSKYQALWNRCHSIASMQPPIAFDKLGMYLAFVGPARLLEARVDEVHGTFCSKVVVRVLKECSVLSDELAHIHPCTATPTSFFCAVRARCIPTARVGV